MRQVVLLGVGVVVLLALAEYMRTRRGPVWSERIPSDFGPLINL